MLCIPIIARNNEEALKKMPVAEDFADILELRLDLMEQFDVAELIQSATKPVLVTYRSVQEGGKGDAGAEAAAGYLAAAMQAGAKLIDVELCFPEEWRAKVLAEERSSGIVISVHINDGTPSRDELDDIYLRCVDTGAEIIKIVTMANAWEDNLRVLDLIPRARAMGKEMIAFCMGPLGRMSRVFSLLMGGYLTFTSLGTGQESAAGQIPVGEMKRLLEQFSP
jgi:3-dehydroquinate dehydratase type I